MWGLLWGSTPSRVPVLVYTVLILRVLCPAPDLPIEGSGEFAFTQRVGVTDGTCGACGGFCEGHGYSRLIPNRARSSAVKGSFASPW
jgi:hypothetical protein